MYKDIIGKIVNESNKVSKQPVSRDKVLLAQKSAKLLSDPKRLVEEPTIQMMPPVIEPNSLEVNKGHSIPIAPPKKSNNRYPTKRVDFGDGIPWLSD